MIVPLKEISFPYSACGLNPVSAFIIFLRKVLP